MPTPTIRGLIIDDDPEMAELLQVVLAPAGVQAEAMTDSRAAAERLTREKFDVVFLDVRMPEPDGLEVARRMRAAGFNQKTPLVMVTGESDLALQRRAFEAGANFFLFKPIERQRVLRVVRATQAFVQHEKRRFQRVPVVAKVSIAAGSETLDGTTLDLSLGGLLAALPSPPPEAADVAVFLHLPRGGPLRARGKVVRVLPEGRVGIQFREMARADSERLQEFLLPLILKQLDEPPR
jgi:CheY-like chemotaxis protein